MPEIIVIAHNIRSTHNVGSIFRTAEGFGMAKIILSGYTPYPKIDNDKRLPHIADKLTHQIHKTALGAENMVDFEYFTDFKDWYLQNELPIIALEQAKSSQLINNFKAPSDFALVLGEEVEGIDKSILKKADYIVEIPMAGQKESFNVSVACGIGLYGLLSDDATFTE